MSRRAYISNLIQKIFILLMCVQIILGLFWMAGNMRDNPFGIVQFFGAAAACYYFFKQGTGSLLAKVSRNGLFILTGYVVTFPVILQCHMSKLPYSLLSSFLLILITDLGRLLKEFESRKRICIVRIGICWLVMGLLELSYGVIVGVAVLTVFVICAWKKWIKWLPILLTMVLVITGVGIGRMVIPKTEDNRIQTSLSSVLLSRFAWPYFVRNSFFWEPEVRELFDNTELAYISKHPEAVLYTFGPQLEEALGKERAREIYYKMAWDSFRIGKKDAVSNFGRDVLANAGGPFAVQYQLSGRGVSYTGMNYIQMKENMPELTKYFVRYSFYIFDFLVIMTACIFVWAKCRDRRLYQKESSAGGGFAMEQRKKGSWQSVVLVSAISVMIVFWYTMTGNGMQDYLKVIPISIFWCMIPIRGYGLLQKVGIENPDKQC